MDIRVPCMLHTTGTNSQPKGQDGLNLSLIRVPISTNIKVVNHKQFWRKYKNFNHLHLWIKSLCRWLASAIISFSNHILFFTIPNKKGYQEYSSCRKWWHLCIMHTLIESLITVSVRQKSIYGNTELKS